jgi:para-nitrobenzyl esterase
MLLDTTGGVVFGDEVAGVAAFHGIRYGRLASGRRFDPVVAARNSAQDLRDSPAVFPQLPSRLDALLGGAVTQNPQEEDAFLLNVWAPAGATDRPVLFYIHGGGFVSGGGVIPSHSGHRLARECDIVVVTMNYRLGPSAHLMAGSEGDDANRSVGDLLQALNWVRENITVFGGDPDNMTVAGQSAGAFYSQLLAVLPESRALIRRLILMSCPGIPASSRSRTQSLSDEIIHDLNGEDPRTAPISTLLASHVRAVKNHAQFGRVGVGLMPTVDARVPDWLGDAVRIAHAIGVTDLLVTFTRDETGSYFYNAPERDITDEQIRRIGNGRNATYETPYAELVAVTTASLFGDHARVLVAASRERGIRAELREFTLASSIDGVGSGHGFDTPFLFGNRTAWSGAQMLEGIDDDLFETEGAKLRCDVADFVRRR